MATVPTIIMHNAQPHHYPEESSPLLEDQDSKICHLSKEIFGRVIMSTGPAIAMTGGIICAVCNEPIGVYVFIGIGLFSCFVLPCALSLILERRC